MTTEALATKEPTVLPSSEVPSPVFRGAQMVRALNDYRELQKALDESMPDQLMTIGDRSFRKKGYWRAIAVAFNLTVECERESRDVLGVLDNGSDNYVYSATYRATAPNGRSAIGDGTCAAAEKQRGRMEATEHNVRSHAHTRAFNRAVSNLVGFGEVSAEEVEREEHGAGEPKPPKRADGTAIVAKVEEKSGTNKHGKAWTSYTVTLDDGRSGSTFDKTLAERAKKAQAGKVLVQTTWEQKGQYTNLTGLEAAPNTPPPAQPPATAPTNGTPDPRAHISDADRKRFWQVARGHHWAEADVSALLGEHGIEASAEITNELFPELEQRLKAGPPAPPATDEPGAGK